MSVTVPTPDTTPSLAIKAAVSPITTLTPPLTQHMLLLFLPLVKGTVTQVTTAAKSAFSAVLPDLRATAGVHFFMTYGVAGGSDSTLPVPTFQAAEGKDAFVVLSIYDAPFTPYIAAFTSVKLIAEALDLILGALDETNIVKPTEPTSAAFILSHGGVFKNSAAFASLLMRYNFGDPALPAATSSGNIADPQSHPKYFLGASFPGLTVGSILTNFPDAGSLWPNPAVPIKYNS